MKLSYTILIGLTATLATSAWADERRFTYVYEPETLPAGAFEVENWVTLRAGRNTQVGQENYRQWQFRQAVEYGVTDRYTVELYANETATSYHDPVTDAGASKFEWSGLSLENRYNILNPAEYAIGLTAYVEGGYSSSEASIEEKIIIGQRHGLWKWAFNLENETEWEDNHSQVEGKFGASFGLARDVGKHVSVGLELRNVTLNPGYHELESTALYLGPVVSYRQGKWWSALTVLPQVHGWNLNGNPDGNSHLDLAENERLQVRFLIGFNF